MNTADRGHRAGAVPVGGWSDPEPETRAGARARRSSPGAWDEDLGRWGAERWNLPGMGESGPGCGEFYPAAVCETCGEPTFGSHTCGRRSCPDCWGVWAKEAAVRATQRVQAFRYTEPDNHRRQVAHAVVSPDEGDVRNKREFFDGRSRAADLAEEKGFRGFAVIPHPWRVTDEGKRLYRAADPDCGIWVWLRNSSAEWREFTYWSPHYHIIGLTSADMEPAESGDEWTYHFIRSVARFGGITDRDSHEDLYGLFRYQLSHVGFPEESTKQITTWYGSLANSVFVEEATEEWQHQKPSEGVRSALRREIEAVAGVTEADEDDESAAESDDEGECEIDGCDGRLIGVFDVRRYLRQTEPPPDVRHAMEAALEWRLGDRRPPPGARRPSTAAEAAESFATLLPE